MQIDFKNFDIKNILPRTEFEKKVLQFLQEWFSDSETVSVQTSGSTGIPKVFEIEKKRMLSSAKMTCDFLGLKEGNFGNYQPNASEKELIMQLSNFKEVVERAAETLSPAQVANYVYDLVKSYNSFYQNNPVMTLDDENAKQFKLQISDLTAKTIRKALNLLGIGVVNRM